MEVDPMEYVDKEEEKKSAADNAAALKSKSRLNTLVAITVALLATFMAVCKIKDDNIVQAMQQAQADKIDNYAWYQARNIREEVANAVVAQLKLQAAAASAEARELYQKEIATYQALANDQAEKKKVQQAAADNADKRYNELNMHDDQFDLSDAMISIAISLLAMTALTGKRWLYVVAMIPTLFGIIMGLAGLLNWSIHPDRLMRWLS
jgi:hypothetical protein